MNNEWLIFKALVPILGQPILVFIYLLARWFARKGWFTLEQYKEHAFNPLGYYLFAIVSLSHTVFNIASLKQNPQPWQLWVSFILLIFFILVHILVVLDKFDDTMLVELHDGSYIGRSMAAAVSATFINLLSLSLFSTVS